VSHSIMFTIVSVEIDIDIDANSRGVIVHMNAKLYLGLALAQSGHLFSTLIKKFKFSVPKDYQAHYVFSLILAMKDGLPVKVQRRDS
jgi:hypothetical protein